MLDTLPEYNVQMYMTEYVELFLKKMLKYCKETLLCRQRQ